MADLFKDLQDELNAEGNVVGLELEAAMQINREMMTVTPGIHISATDFEAPMFLSIQELRDMADAAEKLVKENMK